MRTERDRDQDEIAHAGLPLAVDQHLTVERVIESKPAMALQRGVHAAQAVERRDLRHDVAQRREVARPELVLLRVEIFLAARQCCRLAQLEARIDAPQARQGGGKAGPYE